MIGRHVLAAMAGVLSLSIAAGVADAKDRRDGGSSDGVAWAESRHGNGSVSGPVRLARYGYEVRLPGGAWVGCRRSCEETLRVEALDKWENDGSLSGVGTFARECGIFGCLDVPPPR